MLPGNRFRLSFYPFLTANLSGWIGALIVRAMLHELSVDEHHIFKWRPENKYIQYLILSHYFPGCMPKTLSLNALLNKANWVPDLRNLIKSGYFIKATLGFGSGRSGNFDRTTEIHQILANHKNEHSFKDEKWIIQKRLYFNKEFRVHTFGTDIIYGLTSRISGTIDLIDFDRPQEFVLSILNSLPPSFTEGAFIGWDIGVTEGGRYYVIEANFTGFHPVYHSGFQTTGYVDDPPFGPVVCAWIHAYLKYKYKVSIAAIDKILTQNFPYMREFIYYISVFKNKHIDAIIEGKGRTHYMYIFLGKKTSYNIVKLITFMVMANFANTFYIITEHKLLEKAKELFTGTNIIHLSEQSLLTAEKYEQVNQFDNRLKWRTLFNSVIKLSKGKPYLILK